MAAETPNLGLELRRLNLLELEIQSVRTAIKWGLLEVDWGVLIDTENTEKVRMGQVDLIDERPEKTELLASAVPLLIVVGEGVDLSETENIRLTRKTIVTEQKPDGYDAIEVACKESRPVTVYLRGSLPDRWSIDMGGYRLGWLMPMETVEETSPERKIEALGLVLLKDENSKTQMAVFAVALKKETMLKAFRKDGWLRSKEKIEARKKDVLAKMSPLEIWQEDRRMFFNNLWSFIHDPKKTDAKEEMRRVNLGIAGVSGEVHLSQGKIFLKVYGASRVAFRQKGLVEQAYGVVDRQNLEISLLPSEIDAGGIALIYSMINPMKPTERYTPTLNQNQINNLINLFGQIRPY